MARRVSQKRGGQSKPARTAPPKAGWRKEGTRRVFFLENDRCRIEMWPELGGAITSYVRKPGNLEVMWHNPSLQVPRCQVLSQPAAGGTDLFDLMDGSWWVSLPNGFYPGDYFGAQLGTHGEIRSVPWEVTEVVKSAREVRAVLVGRSVRTPLVYRRELSLRAGSPFLRWRETVRNECSIPLPVAWLQHPAFSGPLIAGARLVAPARKVRIYRADDPNALQLVSGYEGTWPHVPEREGGAMRDVSLVPEAGSGKDHSVQLYDFEDGWACLWNEKLGLGFSFEWDLSIFPYAWSWAYAGGPARWPLWNRGHLITFQPSTSPAARFPELLKENQVLTVPAGGEVTAEMTTGFVTRAEGPWSREL